MLQGLLARTRRYLAVVATLIVLLVGSLGVALASPTGVAHELATNVSASVLLLIAGVYVLDDLVARSRRAELGAYSAFIRKRIAWTADWWPQVAERIVDDSEVHPHPHAPDALRWLIAHAPFPITECAPCLRDAQRMAAVARADLAQLGARWAEVAPADELQLVAGYEDALIETSNGLGNVAHQLEHPDLPGPRDSTAALTDALNNAIREGATKALALYEYLQRELQRSTDGKPPHQRDEFLERGDVAAPPYARSARASTAARTVTSQDSSASSEPPPAEPTIPTAAGERLTHADLAPAHWFSRREESSVWIAAYRVFRLREENAVAQQPTVFDVVQTRVRAHLYVGDLRYTDFAAARLRLEAADRYALDTSNVRERTDPTGAYLLLLTPFDVDGTPGSERDTRDRLDAVVGLLIALEGRNAAFEKVFESVHHFGTGLTTGWSGTVTTPQWYRSPDLGNERLEQIADVETKIEELPDTDRERVRLSLRWHAAAVYDDDVDALIKQWIALETLTMPDGTDIDPLVALLARAHDLAPGVAKEQLSIGRIYRLRGKVVHTGRAKPIHPRILDHMANLYADALCELLGAPGQRRSAVTAVEADGLVRAALVDG